MKKTVMGFLLVHGLIEISGIWIVFAGSSAHVPVFYLDWLNRNILVTTVFGVCAGLIRLVSFWGLFKNRKWGGIMTILISLVTFTTLTFYLPYGALDALLATPPFIMILVLIYGKSELISSENKT